MLRTVWNKLISFISAEENMPPDKSSLDTARISLSDMPGNKLTDSEETGDLLNRLLSRYSDCIFLFDHKGICIHAGASGAPALTLAEVIGKTWQQIGFPPRMPEAFVRSFEMVVRNRQVITGEISVTYGRGNRYFEYTLYPIQSFDAGLKFLITILKDVTARKWNDEELKIHREQMEELIKGRTYDLIRSNTKLHREIVQRRQAEEEVRRSEAQLRRIANAMQDMICQVDREGMIEYASPSYQSVLGYEPDYMVGRSFLEFVYPDDKSLVEQIFQDTLSNPVPGSFEYRHCRNNKENIWVETLANTVTDDQGSISGMILCTRDISERKRIENEMAKLDRMNLVGEMAASIAHEIRNPMTTIRGFLQFLGTKEGCGPYQDSFELMIEELDRANSIISEYLSLAKGKVVNLEKRNLNNIIQVLTPLLQSDALADDKHLEVALGQIPELLLDEKEIRQLIINLVRNALEAMVQGGRVIIRTQQDRNEVVLSVEDEGGGIPPAILEKLGTPFITTKDSGTGLGLPVCYSIAARHNARIEVETDPTGTTFFVHFPADSS